jgi:pantetheine-phosphate adenylyltransferase
MCQRAVFPGTFDPITYGHIEIIKRAKQIFPDLTVAVAEKVFHKKPLFSLKERLMLVKKATQDIAGINIESFDGLLVDYCLKNKIKVIVRGIRNLSDFEEEFQMALANQKLLPNIETVFIVTENAYLYISSRLLKEIAFLGGDISPYVPDFVEKALKEKLKHK